MSHADAVLIQWDTSSTKRAFGWSPESTGKSREALQFHAVFRSEVLGRRPQDQECANCHRLCAAFLEVKDGYSNGRARVDDIFANRDSFALHLAAKCRRYSILHRIEGVVLRRQWLGIREQCIQLGSDQ